MKNIEITDMNSKFQIFQILKNYLHMLPPNIALIIHMSIYRKKPELKYLSTKFENDKEKCLYQAPLENQLKLFSMEQKTVFCKTTS